MKSLSLYSKYLPYLYFISIVIYWFTTINKTNGVSAYPILLFGIPFLWQLLKPNKKLNFTLGITFICLSSYLILGYISNILNLKDLSIHFNGFIVSGWLFVISNFLMAIWIIKNSVKGDF